nr:MAG TPA: Transforming growth factor beta receptor 2 ectodomain [Caudoviricetes sp.]
MTADLAFAIGGIIALCVAIWRAGRENQTRD